MSKRKMRLVATGLKSSAELEQKKEREVEKQKQKKWGKKRKMTPIKRNECIVRGVITFLVISASGVERVWRGEKKKSENRVLNRFPFFVSSRLWNRIHWRVESVDLQKTYSLQLNATEKSFQWNLGECENKIHPNRQQKLYSLSDTNR